jgi:LemA protein
VLIAGWLMVSYNRFVRQRNVVQESWRQVDVELQRRHDLIPNLVESVKAFAAQERNVLVSVIEARNRAEAVRQSPGIHAAEQAQAEGQLQRAIGGLFAVAEAYPDLKSNQNFLSLQSQLAETEDRVAAGRRYYNANVRELNTRVEAFPSNLVAGAFKFGKEEYFEVDDPAARSAVQVDFSGLGEAPQPPPAAH